MDKKQFSDIYEQVKAPYQFGAVLSPSHQSGEFDSELTDNPNVFVTDECPGKFFMTYVGHNGEGYRTGLAVSDDLIFWKKAGVILEPDGNSSWNSYNTAGYIVRDHAWGELPRAHRLSDGRYVMTFFASDTPGYEEGVKRAGIAFVSRLFDDNNVPQKWIKYGSPVLEASPECSEYEKGRIWKLQAIFDRQSGKYHGFYNAGTEPEVMCGAVSNDLVNWTRSAHNPLIDMEYSPDGELWGNTHNGDADVVKIGNVWVMFYFSTTPKGIVDSFALSDNLSHFDKSFIPLTALNDSYASVYAHKPCVFKKNGIVYHFYNAVGSDGRLIALNTSLDLTAYGIAKSHLSQRPELTPYVTEVQELLTGESSNCEDIQSALEKLKNKL